MNKVLIVGANGFIGRNLCQAYLSRSWRVDGVVHRKKDAPHKDVAIFSLDELEKSSRSYDLVILAAGNFRSDPEELLEANVTVPQKITRRFGDSKIIFISSVAVYGMHDDPVTAQSAFQNPGAYGLSKIAGEFVVATHKFGTSIRLSNIYGYGMDKDLFIAKAIDQARTSGSVTLFGDGSRVQDYFYIRDAVRLIFTVSASSKTGIYLGASGVPVPNREVAETICAIIPNTKIVKAGSDQSKSLRANPEETFAAFGFSCEYSLEKGLRDMISHYA